MSAVLKLVKDRGACGHEGAHLVPPSRCKQCRKEAHRARFPHADKRGVKVRVAEDGRECLGCEEMKPWKAFAKDTNGFNQKTATCKECRNARTRAWTKKNPGYGRGGIKNRPAMLKKKYGITYEQVLRMHDEQHGLCANRGCGKEISLEINGITSNRAVIDHDHTTGAVRALLCPPCNMMLGMIETRENALLGLMEYRTKHKTAYTERLFNNNQLKD